MYADANMGHPSRSLEPGLISQTFVDSFISLIRTTLLFLNTFEHVSLQRRGTYTRRGSQQVFLFAARLLENRLDLG